MDAVSTVDRPFGAPLECLIPLPCPPSVNEMWTPRKSRIHSSQAYKAWVRAADAAIMSTGGAKRFMKMPNQFTVLITLDEELCNLDLDNAPKVLIDYCRRRLELMKDDSKRYMREVTVRWGTAPSGCSILLRSIS